MDKFLVESCVISYTLRIVKLPYSPKAPRSPHRHMDSPSALVRLRSIVRQKQLDFAAMCGIPYNTYRACERDSKKPDRRLKALSPDQAGRIALVTGVSREALLRNELLWMDGKTPYSFPLWLEYHELYNRNRQEIQDKWFNLLKDAMVHACAIGEDLPAPSALSWYMRLASDLDKFLRDHSTYLLTGDKNIPTLIELMKKMLRKELGSSVTQGLVDWKE